MLGVETYMLANPGSGGVIRRSCAEFQVEELLPYEFTNSGEFTVLKIEKKGISTIQARNEIAKALGIGKQQVSYAGLKDTQAVTRQYFSLHKVDIERVKQFQHPKIQILELHRHARKIKIGKLYANRFVIIVRDCNPEQGMWNFQELAGRGVPNVFGWQRFGGREGNTHTVGEKIIKKQYQEAIDLIIMGFFGNRSAIQEAYNSREYEKILKMLPRGAFLEKALIKQLLKKKKPEACLKVIDKGMRWLYASAYQAHLFNEILNKRMERGLDVQEGDLVKKYHGIICSSSLMPGFKTPFAGGMQGVIEREVLERHGVEPGDFRKEKLEGKRRANVFPLWGTNCQQDGTTLELRFTIPKGCFATAVLREVMKKDVE